MSERNNQDAPDPPSPLIGGQQPLPDVSTINNMPLLLRTDAAYTSCGRIGCDADLQALSGADPRRCHCLWPAEGTMSQAPSSTAGAAASVRTSDGDISLGPAQDAFVQLSIADNEASPSYPASDLSGAEQPLGEHESMSRERHEQLLLAHGTTEPRDTASNGTGWAWDHHDVGNAQDESTVPDQASLAQTPAPDRSQSPQGQANTSPPLASSDILPHTASLDALIADLPNGSGEADQPVERFPSSEQLMNEGAYGDNADFDLGQVQDERSHNPYEDRSTDEEDEDYGMWDYAHINMIRARVSEAIDAPHRIAGAILNERRHSRFDSDFRAATSLRPSPTNEYVAPQPVTPLRAHHFAVIACRRPAHEAAQEADVDDMITQLALAHSLSDSADLLEGSQIRRGVTVDTRVQMRGEHGDLDVRERQQWARRLRERSLWYLRIGVADLLVEAYGELVGGAVFGALCAGGLWWRRDDNPRGWAGLWRRDGDTPPEGGHTLGIGARIRHGRLEWEGRGVWW